jgi:tRNA nucleotidyltransferase (CCA-adding enzyme)
MKTYLVGGAVRDFLMGLPVSDRDWVVVGGDVQSMQAAGYAQVGRDFPVFLHPRSHEEYALARTERKSGLGYHGFAVHASPEVTLQEDLARRDLTINALAVDQHGLAPDGSFGAAQVIDPFNGLQDLAQHTLRHVSPAFVEDPVRILRLARFAARFTHFTVAPETMALMRSMVDSGEIDHLVAERVWQELAKGLMEQQPSRMFNVLRECGALQRLLPELDRLWGVPQSPQHHPEVDTGVHVMLVLDQAAALQASLPVRFACLTHDLGKGNTPSDVLPRHIGHEVRGAALIQTLCQRLRVPQECAELADLVAREHGNLHRSNDLNADALLRLLERCDALRKPARFQAALLACQCDAQGRLGLHASPYPQRTRLAQALQTVLDVATQPVAQQAIAHGAQGPAVGKAIRKARLSALSSALSSASSSAV